MDDIVFSLSVAIAFRMAVFAAHQAAGQAFSPMQSGYPMLRHPVRDAMSEMVRKPYSFANRGA
jgi:hypothetical protein